MTTRACPPLTAALFLLGLAAGGLAAAPAAAGDPPPDPQALTLQLDLLSGARADLAAAERLGAKKQLPRLHAVVRAAIADAALRIVSDPPAARAGALDSLIGAAAAQALRLHRTARFAADLRQQKPQWQAVAEVYDRDLRAAGRAAGVTLAPALAGSELARALVDSLGRLRLRRLGLADSLNAEWRLERELLQLDLAERDSALTDLRRRVSDLQQNLWDMELRAGVAESERATVANRLRVERARAARVRDVSELFVVAGGEAVLNGAGELVLRHHDFAFAAGATELTPAMARALNAVAAAVNAFPGAPVRVEGHTDSLGGRAENLRLGTARAEAVATALREQLAHLASTAWAVTAVGIGPDRPLVSNKTAVGREKNRRIEVVIGRGADAP